MSKMFSCRPSEILGIKDNYTAFCFDEACCFIRTKLEAGEKPHYNEPQEEKPKEFKTFSEYYKVYVGG